MENRQISSDEVVEVDAPTQQDGEVELRACHQQGSALRRRYGTRAMNQFYPTIKKDEEEDEDIKPAKIRRLGTPPDPTNRSLRRRESW